MGVLIAMLNRCNLLAGCMSDEAFVKVLDEFSGDFLWGTAGAKK